MGRDGDQKRQHHLGGPLCGAAQAAPLLHSAGQAGLEALQESLREIEHIVEQDRVGR